MARSLLFVPAVLLYQRDDELSGLLRRFSTAGQTEVSEPEATHTKQKQNQDVLTETKLITRFIFANHVHLFTS